MGLGSSPRRYRVLALLRSRGSMSLEDIAGALGVSKTAALKHLRELEEEGLVERSYVRKGRGRPVLVFRASRASVLHSSHGIASIAVESLRYIERVLGREHVARVLNARCGELARMYASRFQAMGREERVRELARVRSMEGYVASWRKLGNGSYEIVEENCPIILVSQEYSEACMAEVRLFSTLLGAEVEATHRIVNGSPVCRFLIRFRRE
ncbi:MAG: helix-turn-helix domain-containing protein [Desulfurococcales archaeon]|nr:helix-turn-helix domain-containing protein [Desulfurococcales archaeon]